MINASKIHFNPFIILSLGSIEMDHVISELCYKGVVLQKNYRKITTGSQDMTVLYPNPCYNEGRYNVVEVYYDIFKNFP